MKIIKYNVYKQQQIYSLNNWTAQHWIKLYAN